MAVSGKVLRALVDTGSERMLIRRSAVDRIGGDLNTRRALPNLQGVTGDPLRILGMTWVKLGVGDNKVSKQWIPVIPDTYLQTDLLLGCDILGQATLTWQHTKGLLVWGGTPYVVNMVRKHHRQVERVRVISPTPNDAGPVPKSLRVRANFVVPPYQSCIALLPVDEDPGTTVLVYPEAKTSQCDYPVCTTVNEQRQIACPVTNASKARKILKTGTYLGSYERAGEVADQVRTVIQNNLLPHADQPGKGDRESKIQNQIKYRKSNKKSKIK